MSLHSVTACFVLWFNLTLYFIVIFVTTPGRTAPLPTERVCYVKDVDRQSNLTGRFTTDDGAGDEGFNCLDNTINCIPLRNLCDNTPDCADASDENSHTCISIGRATCSDQQMNGNETDIDCGGIHCPACHSGQDVVLHVITPVIAVFIAVIVICIAIYCWYTKRQNRKTLQERKAIKEPLIADDRDVQVEERKAKIELEREEKDRVVNSLMTNELIPQEIKILYDTVKFRAEIIPSVPNVPNDLRWNYIWCLEKETNGQWVVHSEQPSMTKNPQMDSLDPGYYKCTLIVTIGDPIPKFPEFQSSHTETFIIRVPKEILNSLFTDDIDSKENRIYGGRQDSPLLSRSKQGQQSFILKRINLPFNPVDNEQVLKCTVQASCFLDENGLKMEMPHSIYKINEGQQEHLYVVVKDDKWETLDSYIKTLNSEKGKIRSDRGKSRILFKKLCKIIKGIHHNGYIIHSDLRLSTIMINEDSMDVSLCCSLILIRNADFNSVVESTKTNLYKIPEDYQTDEHCKNGDIFILGIILFQLVQETSKPTIHKELRRARNREWEGIGFNFDDDKLTIDGMLNKDAKDQITLEKVIESLGA